MTPRSTRRTAPDSVPRSMRSGVRGATELQVFMRDLGYFNGRIDGFYGNTTRNAVANYQKDLGVNVTGHFDQVTRDAAISALTGELTSTSSASSSPPSPSTSSEGSSTDATSTSRSPVVRPDDGDLPVESATQPERPTGDNRRSS